MKFLEVVGWIAVFFFISIVSFWDATTISITESRTLIHFPYHVWKAAQAIWWLLLSFVGLLIHLIGK